MKSIFFFGFSETSSHIQTSMVTSQNKAGKGGGEDGEKEGGTDKERTGILG